MNKVADGTPSGTPAPQTPPQPTANSGAEPAGNFDDYGYEIVGEQPAPTPQPSAAPAGQPQQTPPAEPPKADDGKVNLEGYGEEPPAPAAPTEPVTPPKKDGEAPPAKTDIGLGFDLKIDGVKSEDVEVIKQIAKEHGLNEKQAQALIDVRRAETSNNAAAQAKAEEEFKAQAEERKQAQRREWHSSLKNDATFGGENFAHNLKQAEKTFEQFFPETKKAFDEKKGMLPPYLMRDLAALGRSLNETPKFNQGSAPAAPTKADDDPLSFYG